MFLYMPEFAWYIRVSRILSFLITFDGNTIWKDKKQSFFYLEEQEKIIYNIYFILADNHIV